MGARHCVVDPRLSTIERRVGVPILSGGVFSTRLDVPSSSGVIGVGVSAIRWLMRRSRSPFPNYVVLAASQDTLFVFAAAIAADEIGDQLASWRLDEVVARRGGHAWDIDMNAQGQTFNLTAVDKATLDLIERLVASPR